MDIFSEATLSIFGAFIFWFNYQFYIVFTEFILKFFIVLYLGYNIEII